MNAKDFLNELDDTRVVDAIARGESQTSGEIRVFVDHLNPPSVLSEAARQFERMGMTKTRERNGVLIYFAPLARRFAVLGDEGVHAKCGQDFWEGVTDEMSASLKSGKFTEAIIHAVEKIGEVLAKHFPRRPDDTDELPNEIGR